MTLIESVFPEIKRNIGINSRNHEYQKIKDAISVLNVAYLKLASEEMKYYMQRNPAHRIPSKFTHLMDIYNRLIHEHQAMFLLLNVFETALRSKAAILLSNHFSTQNSDDWWKDISKLDKDLLDPVNKAVAQLHRGNYNLANVNTFDLFDTFTFGQLENIYKNYWSIFHHIFVSKNYRAHTLPQMTRSLFLQKMKDIRLARNDVAHHKPIDYQRRGRQNLIHDMELILRHLNFNVEDTINGINGRNSIINLQYI
ncbi:Abi family protein [Sulfurimonas sp.]|uniref:Abi family protein n=1 Tax=Sulfurimonas sp. TaxID=2022749 RepID=UPI003D115258